uniref:Uncharacterized protein n=1 Tax=Fibrocapsa japonica TaxID=94617 RepID=A0A7S2UUJ2_9STRA
MELHLHNPLVTAGLHYLYLHAPTMEQNGANISHLNSTSTGYNSGTTDSPKDFGCSRDCPSFPPDCLDLSPFEAGTMRCMQLKNCHVEVNTKQLDSVLRQAISLVRLTKRSIDRSHENNLWQRGLLTDDRIEPLE